MIPVSHQPQGFSSTYFQELQKIAAANPPITAPAASLAPPRQSGAASRIGGPKDRVPKPMKLTQLPPELEEEPLEPVPEIQGPDDPLPAEEEAETPTAAATGSWWSWLRRPLTSRSAESTAAEEAFSEELDRDDEARSVRR